MIGVLVTSLRSVSSSRIRSPGAIQSRRNASVVLTGAIVLVLTGDLGFVLGNGLWVWFPARILMGLGAGGLWFGVIFGIMERYPGEVYRRVGILLGAYSVGGVAGPGLAAVGGIRAPFLIHLGLVGTAGLALALARTPRTRPRFSSDRNVLRSHGFMLAASGVALVAVGLGTLEGTLPLHFSTHLSQAGIALLLVGRSVVLGVAVVASSRFRPRYVLAVSAVLLPAGLALAGAAGSVWLWAVAVGVAAVGFGLGETGSLGVLLETVGAERIVLAMVIWSMAWGAGYLAGPALSGAVAEGLGFGAVGLVPAVAASLVVAVFVRAPRTA